MCKNLSPTKTRRGICLVLPHTGYALGCWFETSSDKLQNVSQSVSVSSLKTVCLITVKFLKVSSGKCQQHSDDAVKISNIFGFSTFKGSVLTYCRWGGNLCDFYIENFLTNHLVKKKIENRSTSAKVIIKHQVAYFFGTRCIFVYSIA